MKNKIKWILAAAIVVLIIAAGYKFLRSPVEVVSVRANEPVLAFYDRNNVATGREAKSYVHLALRWNDGDDKDLEENINKVWIPGKPVLLTIETWPGKFSNENVLVQIDKGKYDQKISALGKFLSKQKQSVLLRLNPDMEVYVDLFPWQKQAPDQYAKAFNHFSQILKGNAPAVKMVWAPAGYPGTEEYWPGEQWVDMISVTLKGKAEMMTNNYPEEKSLQQLIFRKLHRLRFFDKPVAIIGSDKVSASDFKQNDFDAAVSYIQQHKDIEYIDINAADKKTADSILRKEGALKLGTFDPFHLLVDSVPVNTEHLFVNIRALKSGVFKQRFDSIVARKHNIIVTMEPWRDKNLDKDPELMKNILSGKYDSLIEEMCKVITSTNNTVYLRWLHEMEIPIKRYPWQSQDPIQYIKAYRYFVNYVRTKKASNIYYVWGPAGDRGSMEFWPGSDVVDYVSIAIYGLPDKNITDHNKQESFSTIYKRKYRRIWFAQRPLFITEFGVKGPADYKKQWLDGAAKTIEENKEITGISYFSDADSPKAWGDIEAPDWSITPGLFNGFARQLTTSLKQ